MKSDVFEFRDPRLYLLSVLGDKRERKGMKSQAARATGCHTTVISQILHGKVRLNLEQAERFNEFLNHGPDESHYFLLLVQRDRAGTRSLERYFERQLSALREGRLVLKKRIGQTAAVSKENEHRYYAAWHYAALHVALSVAELRTAEALARHFRLPLALVNEALEFLVSAGLAVRVKGEYGIGPKHLHLGAGSPHVSMHHRNWRLKAMQSLDGGVKGGLHYSAAVTLSREDAILVKDMIIEHLKGVNKVIATSAEEEVYAMSFDFFVL